MLTPSCPTGSHDNGGTCYYDADASVCLPILLGTDGHVDLGGFFASISPGTAGGLDFVLAGGGDAIDSTSIMNGTLVNTPDSTNGITLGLMGGGLPNPQSSCVPPYTNVVPTGIPIPDEMQDNSVSPWPMNDNGPDVGIALAARYLNFAFGSVYNSGALCLGISTDQYPQLQSGLLSVLIPSIKRLTFEQLPGPVAVTTRPQNPLVAKIGGGTDINMDPLLSVSLKQFAIDFYVWSTDRYVRAMTFTGDLTIPVNLSTHVDPTTNPTGGILPALGTVVVANAVVTNSELLVDNPTIVASGLGSLFGAITGQLAGALKPISLASSLAKYGLGMTIPDGGIRKISKSGDDFLAIFADLSLAMQNAVVQADVQAKIVSKQVFPEAMSLATADRTKEPKLHVLFGTVARRRHARHRLLVRHRPGHAERVVDDQGLHHPERRPLHAGQAHAERLGPRARPGHERDRAADAGALHHRRAAAEHHARRRRTTRSGDIQVSAWDLVSATSALQMRYKTTDSLGHDSAWTAWTPIADLSGKALGGASATVEVQRRGRQRRQPVVRPHSRRARPVARVGLRLQLLHRGHHAGRHRVGLRHPRPLRSPRARPPPARPVACGRCPPVGR